MVMTLGTTTGLIREGEIITTDLLIISKGCDFLQVADLESQEQGDRTDKQHRYYT